jgi:[ribosomal protein S5]-alanine N-acetyltransferase
MAFYTTPTLETERLLLRPLVLEDADTAQLLFDNPIVVKYLDARTIPQPYPADGVRQYYLDYLLPDVEAGRTLAWSIIERAPSQLTGVLQLTPEHKKDSRGFWLGARYHRRGYITEVIVATTDYAFDVLGMPCMLLNNAEPNVASRRVKEKADAEFIGMVKNKAFVGGIFNQEYWRLTPERWHASPMKRAAASPSYRLIS